MFLFPLPTSFKFILILFSHLWPLRTVKLRYDTRTRCFSLVVLLTPHIRTSEHCQCRTICCNRLHSPLLHNDCFCKSWGQIVGRDLKLILAVTLRPMHVQWLFEIPQEFVMFLDSISCISATPDVMVTPPRTDLLDVFSAARFNVHTNMTRWPLISNVISSTQT
jgi:hypothetical protein